MGKKSPSGIQFQMLGVSVLGMLEWKVHSELVSLVPAIIGINYNPLQTHKFCPWAHITCSAN